MARPSIQMRGFLLSSAVLMLALFSGCGGGASGANPSPVLSSIRVTGPSNTLTAGQKQQMTAIGTYSNGSTQDLTGSATWSSSSSSVATVAAGGMVTANTSGACTIAAKLGNVT